MKNNVYAPGLILTKYLILISEQICNSIRKSNFIPIQTAKWIMEQNKIILLKTNGLLDLGNNKYRLIWLCVWPIYFKPFYSSC